MLHKEGFLYSRGMAALCLISPVYRSARSGGDQHTLPSQCALCFLLQYCVVIDPHGDLVEAMLDLVPPHRVQEIIYFNPADTAYPLAFNPLDCTTSLPASLVASSMLSVLKKTWPAFWVMGQHFSGHSISLVCQTCSYTSGARDPLAA